MFHTLFLMALSTVAVAGLSPNRAEAQFYNNFSRNYYSGYNTGYNSGFMPGLYINNPYTGQSFSYNYTTQVSLGADYVNPYTGIRNTFYYNSYQSGPFLPTIPFTPAYAAYNSPAYSGYGLGGGYRYSDYQYSDQYAYGDTRVAGDD